MGKDTKPRDGDQDAIEVNETAAQSVGMLKAVISGETYEAVAARFGKSRTAVERRIKAIAAQLSKEVGIQGLNEEGAAFVRRLRLHQDAILMALESFEPSLPCGSRETRILSSEEIAQAVLRIKGRSSRPWHDIALFYLLFATGARPLEIARLEVRDYLDADGSVRRESQMRAEVAITRKPRSLYFTSTRLDEVLTLYLKERLALQLGVHTAGAYRGLDPDSRLFLSATGEGFKVTPYGKEGQLRFLCRPILETYDKLFRYAELKGVSALSARRTVISRLYERGANEDQVGLLLGISERSAVRALLSRPKPTIAVLVNELI
ncbi:site-specific integrase [Rhodoferax sediminis]|uniref:Site-specific integrase n=2 Tax=Rhodoferax sediminis TaxID=2509614 RepID=A0A515DDT9_9BURK|nr:site-specific integrase [Rhodoferax sediminis]